MPTVPIRPSRGLRRPRARGAGRRRRRDARPSRRRGPAPPDQGAPHQQPVTCVPSAANTVRAEVRLWMSVVNYDGWADWADHMEARARLEATPPPASARTGTG